MMASAWELTVGFQRATIIVSVSALLVHLLLGKLHVASSRVHRAAWFLVVLQGCWFLPTWTVHIPVHLPWISGSAPESGLATQPVKSASDLPAQYTVWHVPIDGTNASGSSPQKTDTPLLAVLTVVWLAGMLVLIANRLYLYMRFTRQVPLGDLPKPDWAREWQKLLAAWRVRRQIPLRITKKLGPVLCFLPVGYVVLAPRSLWMILSETERSALLKHELAHYLRCDIWKSLAIRLLALPQWFNPCVWWAVRRFDEGAEWACDEAAKGTSPQENISYSRALLRMGELGCSSAPHAMAARGGVLRERVRRVLASHHVKEDSVMKRMFVVAVLLSICLTQMIRFELVADETTSPGDEAIVSAVYNVADLVQAAAADGEEAIAVNFAPLIDEITSTIAPDSWDEMGGEGSIRPFEPNLSLLVSQHQSVHNQIVALLNSTRKQADLKRTGLAPYRIEPLDVVLIQAVRLRPKRPYRIQAVDILQIVATENSDGETLAGTFQVESDGTVNLGASNGRVRVQGMSTGEAAGAIEQHFDKEGLSAAKVSVSKPAGQQSIVGEHLVGPDGRINLGRFDNVSIAGMTVAEARRAIQTSLEQYFDEPAISLEMFAYNSKCYYVIVQGKSSGDLVYRFPITGNETVLDAIAQIQVNERVSTEAKVWVSRRVPYTDTGQQILPVEWKAITQGGLSSTNYQLLPGDRVFVDVGHKADARESADSQSAPHARHDRFGDAASRGGNRELIDRSAHVLIKGQIFELTIGGNRADDVLTRLLPKPLRGTKIVESLRTIDSAENSSHAVRELGRARIAIVESAATANQIQARLQPEGTVKLLASPQLITLSGLPAQVKLGVETPVPAGDNHGESSVADKLEAGIRLDYVPIVLGNGMIQLEVRAEVSEFVEGPGSKPEVTNARIRKRWMEAAFEIKPSQSIVLAWLNPEPSEQTSVEKEAQDCCKGIIVIATPSIVETQADTARE